MFKCPWVLTQDATMMLYTYEYCKSRNLYCIKVMRLSVTLIKINDKLMSSKSCEFQPWDACSIYILYSLSIRITNGSLILLIFSGLDISIIYCCNAATDTTC